MWSRISAVLIFIAHQFIGALGVVYLSNFMVIALGGSLTVLNGFFHTPYATQGLRWVLLETPFFPIQIAMGLSLGWTLYRRFQHRSMLWVWIIPLAILGYAVIALPTIAPDMTSVFNQSSALSHYFGWGCSPKNGCYDQIIVTVPCYAAAAYSIGAALAKTWSNAAHKEA